MSYQVSLMDGDGYVEVPPHQEGGNVAVDGDDFASMSVTYNYCSYYYGTLHANGLRGLNGMSAKDSIPLLRKAFKKLGTEYDADYWAKTPGNAGHALKVMYNWARLYPNAVWSIQ